MVFLGEIDRFSSFDKKFDFIWVSVKIHKNKRFLAKQHKMAVKFKMEVKTSFSPKFYRIYIF
jgi:hypothetical protein